jgi:hypothetical protein
MGGYIIGQLFYYDGKRKITPLEMVKNCIDYGMRI